MSKLIRSSLGAIALFFLAQNCTLIADVDRDAIDGFRGGSGGDAGDSGATSQGGDAPRAGGGGGGVLIGSGGTPQAGSGGESGSGDGGAPAGSGGVGGTDAGAGGEPPMGGGGSGAGQGGMGGGDAGAGGSCSLTLCGDVCLDPAVTPTHCGACDRACSASNTSQISCQGNVCLPTCTSGFADCAIDDGTGPDDGCETNTNGSSANCGRCGRACAVTPGTASTSCSGGLCAPTCRPGYGDCSTDDGVGEDDGCETNLNANLSCGTACGTRTACASNLVCNAGACGAPAGVAVLSVPLADPGDQQRYLYSGALSLLNATITARVYAPGATGGTLQLIAVDSTAKTSPVSLVPLSSLSAGWSEIALPLGAASGNFDPGSVTEIRLELAGGTDTSFPTTTVVYLDSLVSSNGALASGFDANLGSFSQATEPMVAGSVLDWAAALP